MRKPHQSTTLAERLINMRIEAAYPYCIHEIETTGRKFHDTLLLALEKMSKDIKKRFKSGDDPTKEMAMEDAMMLIELCNKLNEAFGKDVFYNIHAIKMGEFAERCIKSDPSNAKAKKLIDFYREVRKI